MKRVPARERAAAAAVATTQGSVRVVILQAAVASAPATSITSAIPVHGRTNAPPSAPTQKRHLVQNSGARPYSSATSLREASWMNSRSVSALRPYQVDV